MLSTKKEFRMLESKSKMLRALVVAAFVYCFVATINLLYEAIPIIPWFWQPDEAKKLDVPANIEDLIPSEEDHLKHEPGRFTTLSKFRNKNDFPQVEAIQQYHSDPVAYALRLAEVTDEICEIVHQSDPAGYRAWLARERYKRQKRDFAGGDIEGKVIFMTLRELFLPGQAVQANLLFRELGRFGFQTVLRLFGFKGVVQWGTEPPVEILTGAPREVSPWIKELENFRKNIISFCEYTGSEVDKLATPPEIVWRLRKYSSEGKLMLSPLYIENAQLGEKLSTYKRIIAALQTRHTLERLVAQMPEGGKATPKWKKLWENIWRDAETDVGSPFHTIWKDAGKKYLRDDINLRGQELYAYMSSEIHWFGQKNFDYEHFDIWTKKICEALRPTLVEEAEDKVNWEKELAKYCTVAPVSTTPPTATTTPSTATTTPSTATTTPSTATTTLSTATTTPSTTTSAEANMGETEVPGSLSVAESFLPAAPAPSERADLGVTDPEDDQLDGSEGHAEHYPTEHSAESIGEESPDNLAPDFETIIDEAGRVTRTV